MRQQEIDAAAITAAYDEPYGWQDDGSYDVGTFRSRQNRHVNLQRMSTFGAVSRNSLQFRHANARVRRWWSEKPAGVIHSAPPSGCNPSLNPNLMGVGWLQT
jgi:hypothetical protein